MINFATRREVLGTLLFASIGGILPGSNGDGKDTKPSDTSPASPNLECARNLILEAIARRGAMGVAIAVAHHGKIIWEEGFGWANRELHVKATAHTPFTLASITKPFTATTLLTLAAEGKLSLDDSVNKHLKNSRIRGVGKDAAAATIRLLGAHVSGLPTMYEGYNRQEAKRAPSAEGLIKNYGRLAYPPSSCYEYSNVGYDALAVIASNLTGTDFGTLLTQRLLAPLDLCDSFFDTNLA